MNTPIPTHPLSIASCTHSSVPHPLTNPFNLNPSPRATTPKYTKGPTHSLQVHQLLQLPDIPNHFHPNPLHKSVTSCTHSNVHLHLPYPPTQLQAIISFMHSNVHIHTHSLASCTHSDVHPHLHHPSTQPKAIISYVHFNVHIHTHSPQVRHLLHPLPHPGHHPFQCPQS